VITYAATNINHSLVMIKEIHTTVIKTCEESDIYSASSLTHYLSQAVSALSP